MNNSSKINYVYVEDFEKQREDRLDKEVKTTFSTSQTNTPYEAAIGEAIIDSIDRKEDLVSKLFKEGSITLDDLIVLLDLKRSE